MKYATRLSLCITAVYLASLPQSAAGTAGAGDLVAVVNCGVERWAAKGLTDGTSIDFDHPIRTTVRNLRQLERPPGVENHFGPRTPEEARVYKVHATLRGYKINIDHDLYLVISDFGGNPSDTMVAEVPDGECDGVSGDGHTHEFTTVRSAIQSRYGLATSSMNMVNAEVEITGVLFFDFMHGQRGVAPNGVELHPVTNLEFGPNGGSTAN